LKKGSKNPVDAEMLNINGYLTKVIVVLTYNDALYKKTEIGNETKIAVPIFFDTSTFAKMFIHDILASGVKFSISKSDMIKEDVYVPANKIETICTKTVKLPKEEVINAMKAHNPFLMSPIKEVL
jgi:hypothetical protein